MSGLSEDVSTPLSPPPLPPNHPRESENFLVDEIKKDPEISEDWTLVEKSEVFDEERLEVSPPVTPSTSSTGSTPGKIKWKKPRWAKKCELVAFTGRTIAYAVVYSKEMAKKTA